MGEKQREEDVARLDTASLRPRLDPSAIYPTPRAPKPVQDVTPEELAEIDRPLAFRVRSLLIAALVVLAMGMWNAFSFLTTGFFFFDSSDLHTTSHDSGYYFMHLSLLAIGVYLLFGKSRGTVIGILYSAALIGGAYLFISAWTSSFTGGVSFVRVLLVLAGMCLAAQAISKVHALVD